MKIRAVISTDIIKSGGFIKHKLQLLNPALLALALVSGTVLYVVSRDYLTGEIWECFTGFFLDFSSKTKLEVFSGMLLSHLPYLVLTIVFGTCSMGYILVITAAFVKIMGIGMIATYLYSSFGLQGIEYALLIFFPGKFLMIFSMLYLMDICTTNSLYIKSLTKGESIIKNSSNLYTVRTVTAVIVFTFSLLIDCFLAVSFSSLFSFIC